MPDQFHIPQDRPLSNSELRLLEWLLDNGGPDAASYKWQIPKLPVVAKCSCGCPTVDFAMGKCRKEGASQIIADINGTSPEGVSVGVILHVREGEISELEVYSQAGDNAGFSLPQSDSLLRCTNVQT